MTIGSAASLAGTLPEAPLSPFPAVRSWRPITAAARTSGQALPPGNLSLSEADDPPRRILVVDRDTLTALELQRLLREAGYRVVGPAGSADEADRLIDRADAGHRPIQCAVIDGGVFRAAAIADRLVERGVPLIWLAPAEDAAFAPAGADTPVLPKRFDRDALLDALEQAMRRAAGARLYPMPPPQPVWPRVFPQL